MIDAQSVAGSMRRLRAPAVTEGDQGKPCGVWSSDIPHGAVRALYDRISGRVAAMERRGVQTGPSAMPTTVQPCQPPLCPLPLSCHLLQPYGCKWQESPIYQHLFGPKSAAILPRKRSKFSNLSNRQNCCSYMGVFSSRSVCVFE